MRLKKAAAGKKSGSSLTPDAVSSSGIGGKVLGVAGMVAFLGLFISLHIFDKNKSSVKPAQTQEQSIENMLLKGSSDSAAIKDSVPSDPFKKSGSSGIMSEPIGGVKMTEFGASTIVKYSGRVPQPAGFDASIFDRFSIVATSEIRTVSAAEAVG